MQDGKRWITWKGRRILVDNNKQTKINEQEYNYGDYNYGALGITDKEGNAIATLTYLKLNDMNKSDIYKGMFGGSKIAIERIDTKEEHRRKGYATALLRKLQSKYPNEEIRFGQLEPEGEKLFKSVANITRTELKEGHKRLTHYGKIKMR